MKRVLTTIICLLPVLLWAQNAEYNVTSYHEEGTKAPNVRYIGEAWLNPLLRDDGKTGYNMTKATFKANSTLDWHKHSSVQVLIYVEGEGYYQERGKDAVILKAGDVVKCEPGVEHWHSSTKESDVTYLALYGGSEPTTWTEVVSPEYYDEVAKGLKE